MVIEMFDQASFVLYYCCMLSVPFYHQKKPYTCGPAVMRMVFRYFGHVYDEIELERRLKAEPLLGTRHRYLIRIARRNGFYSYVNHGSNLAELKYFLSLELPPIVRLSARLGSDKDEGHYAVVTAVTKRHIYLNDPWRGADFQISVKSFLREWRDNETGKTYERWMMVLSPKKISIGRIYIQGT